MPMMMRDPIRLFVAVICLVPAAAIAAPQAQPGDVGLRHDLQVLADYGAIRGPMTTWPVAWDAVLHDLEEVVANDVVLPNRVLPTFDRVLSRARREAARGRVSFDFGASVAEEPIHIRGFSDTPREDAEVEAGVSWFSEHLTLDLNVSGVDNPADGEDVRADGSQLGVDFGNWSFAASTLDRWWGPGWDGSLILSNNARPVPSLAIGRNLTTPFDTKWLSWLGPWDLQVLFGQLESDRYVPDARFFGMRFNFRPFESLEIGLSRTAQWCGEGRPCGFDTFWELFWGNDNLGDDGVSESNEPGNQLAGFDARWTNMWFETPVSLYAQLIGEDEAGGFPSRYLAQFGVEGSGITRGQTSFRWFVEVAGTSADFLKDDRYNGAYRHGIYQSGYNYYGRIIGHGLDNDAYVYSAGVVAVTENGNSWNVIARVGDINRGGPTDDRHSIATDPAELASVDIQHNRRSRFGDFFIGIGYQSLEDVASGDSVDDTRAFLQWRYDWDN
jgi:hypothetical protein